MRQQLSADLGEGQVAEFTKDDEVEAGEKVGGAPGGRRVGGRTPRQLRKRLADCVVALNGHTQMDRDLLLVCPPLRSIVFLGTGASNYVDLSAASERGIRVRTVQGYGDCIVAERAFALMISAAMRVSQMYRVLRTGLWTPLTGVELEGKVLGIIGMGDIGRAVARIAGGFGMRVLAWNRHPISRDAPCQPATLEELLG